MALDLFTGNRAPDVPRGPDFDLEEATFGEGFGAAMSAASGTIRNLRVDTNQVSHVQEWIDKFEKASGYAPQNPELYGRPGDRTVGFGELRKAYDAAKLKTPDLDLPPPPNEGEGRAAAIDLERKREAEAAAVFGRPQTFQSGAGAVFGGLLAAAADPINLASMAATVPTGIGILATALRVGVIGGVSQAAISTASFGVNREINPDYGVSDAVSETMLAAAGGAILGGGIKSLAVAWQRLTGRPRVVPAPEARPAPEAASESPSAPAEASGEPPDRQLPDAARAFDRDLAFKQSREISDRANAASSRNLTGARGAMPSADELSLRDSLNHALAKQASVGPVTREAIEWARTNGRHDIADEIVRKLEQAVATAPEGTRTRSAYSDFLAALERDGLRVSGSDVAIPPHLSVPEPTQLDLIPRDVRDAGNIVTREAAVSEASPYKSAGLDGELAHARNYGEAEKALSEGRAPEIPQDQFAAGTWRPGKVFTSGGHEVGVRYEVVEADSLVASQRADLSPNPDYPPDLQPRDRTRAASSEQINEIASKLKPDRLGVSSEAATGAPVVGPDDVIESGNGRWLALKRAYATDGAPTYGDYLRAQGHDTTGFREPVLIARRTTPMTDAERIGFTAAANRSVTARMSAPEQALADARLLDGPVIAKLAEGGIESLDNRPFVKGMFKNLPVEERASLIDRHGVLSAEGIRRVEAALLARAYGDPALLSRILESPDSNIKALGGALTDTAGPWSGMRDAVSRGTVPAGMDITRDVLDAMRLVAKARDEKVKLTMLVDQAEMFEAPSPITRALLQLMFRDEALTKAASRASVARGLKAYADEAVKNTTDARLFDEPLTADAVLTASLAKAGREDLAVAAEQATLPLAARETLAKPEVDDAVLHQLEHLQDQSPEPIMVPHPDGTLNADGSPVMVSVKSLVDEADAEIAAAKEIEACATGNMAQAAE